MATKILCDTSSQGRQVSRHSRNAAVEPSQIRFDDETVPVDASTDLVCFVLRKRWQPLLQHRRIGTGPELNLAWMPPLDHEDIAFKLGNVRRAGVLLAKPMWYAVLAIWLNPDRDDDSYDYLDRDGRLSSV